jgi:hypothetical protein
MVFVIKSLSCLRVVTHREEHRDIQTFRQRHRDENLVTWLRKLRSEIVYSVDLLDESYRSRFAHAFKVQQQQHLLVSLLELVIFELVKSENPEFSISDFCVDVFDEISARSFNENKSIKPGVLSQSHVNITQAVHVFHVKLFHCSNLSRSNVDIVYVNL